MSASEVLDEFDVNYLNSLLSFGVDRLIKEADILKVEKDQAELKLKSVFLDNYEGVLDTTRNLDVISNKLAEASTALENFEKDIPKFCTVCNDFLENCSSIVEDAKDAKLLSVHQSQVTDLLDIPQLLDTCVRNGMYDEAMEIMSYVSRMQVLHPNLNVTRGLAEATQAGSARLLEQLLGTFRSGAQLPECLRAVGYIRRLANFSDLEMRTIFLSCRDVWISNIINAIDEGNSFHYIKKLADVYRLQVYDTTIQYKTIFYDVGKDFASPSSLGVDSSSSSSASATASTSSPAAAVFASWSRAKIRFLEQQVAVHLPHITEGGQLSAAAEHLSFCASSLSRVGLDFATLIEPLVNTATLTLFARNLSAASDIFAARMATHKWIALPMPSTATSSSPASGSDASVSGAAGGQNASSSSGVGGTGGGAGGGGVIELPYSLLAHPPLAAFLNGIAFAMNELRLCLTAGAAAPAQKLLAATIERGANQLVQQRLARPLDPSEADQLAETAREFRDVALPCLQSAARRLFAAAAVDATPQPLDVAPVNLALQKLLMVQTTPRVP